MIYVIIPALNEEKAIAKVISDIPKVVTEIVVVDNGSLDRTSVVARNAGATVLKESRAGYGYACLKGINHLKDKQQDGDIIVFLEKIMKQQEVDAVFVDPYNSLKLELGTSNKSSHEYHYEAASEFLTFSTANDVAVWLNMHAFSEAQRRKGDDGLPVAPYAEDTEGGGKFVNRADCFVTIHRKVQHPDHSQRKVTEFHVRKVRDVETGGQPTPLDNPIRFEMNTSMTGFRVWPKQDMLFQSVDLQGGEQDSIKFHFNSSFLEK